MGWDRLRRSSEEMHDVVVRGTSESKHFDTKRPLRHEGSRGVISASASKSIAMIHVGWNYDQEINVELWLAADALQTSRSRHQRKSSLSHRNEDDQFADAGGRRAPCQTTMAPRER